MLSRFTYILMYCTILFSTFTAAAQTILPDSTCNNLTKHYFVTPNPIPGSSYTWKIDGILQTTSTTNQIDITWTSTGTYWLEVQELTLDGCLGPIQSGMVLVNPQPTIIAYCNSPICEATSINFSSQTILGGTYLWTGPNGFESSAQNPEIQYASIADAGTYSLSLYLYGCISEPSLISISVNQCPLDFFIPEGYSPNGDGINDLFVIRGIDSYPNNSIIIFNRWGNKVFEAHPYQNTWDGTCSFGLTVGDNQLPDATYFYLLDLGDGSKIIKGYIYLSR